MVLVITPPSVVIKVAIGVSVPSHHISKQQQLLHYALMAKQFGRIVRGLIQIRFDLSSFY